MLEVRERGPEAAEQARHRPGHPQLLRAGAELDRLDTPGDELGVARDRGEAELVAGERGQPAEQVLDVGLVAGALPAEDVGVDDDERRHAAASS